MMMMTTNKKLMFLLFAVSAAAEELTIHWDDAQEDDELELTSRRRALLGGKKEEGTPADTTGGCPDKRVYITEICELDDLEPSRNDIDIRVHLNSNVFWPADVSVDCNGQGSDFVNSCRVHKNLIVKGNCFPLTNSPSRLFRNLNSVPSLAIQITDVDSFSNDHRRLSVDAATWYDRADCGVRTLETPRLNNDGSPVSVWVKYTVDSTGSVNLPPSPAPTPAGVVPTPAADGPHCDVETSIVLDGITQAGNELSAFSDILQDLSSDRRTGRRRRIQQGYYPRNSDLALWDERDERDLLWPALIAGARTFGSLFTRKNAGSAFSSLADAVGLGADFLDFFGAANDGGSDGPDEETLALFDQVFERFDAIDSKLELIDQQLADGFQSIKDFIALTTAEGIIRDVSRELDNLETAYKQYVQSTDTEVRAGYAEIFRGVCTDPNKSALSSFEFLHKFVRPSGDADLTDPFVDQAIAFSSTSEQARKEWFRSNFSAMMMNLLVKAMYLYSACLLPGCPNNNSVRQNQLESMSSGLEESAIYLSGLESRLLGLCKTKKIRVKRICNLSANLDTGIGENDGVLEIEVEIKEGGSTTKYWPRSTGSDCAGGTEQNGCKFSVSSITGPEDQRTKCVSAKNAVTRTYTSAQSLEWRVVELDDQSFDDRIVIDLPASIWYRSDILCNTITVVASGRNGFSEYATLEFEITSS